MTHISHLLHSFFKTTITAINASFISDFGAAFTMQKEKKDTKGESLRRTLTDDASQMKMTNDSDNAENYGGRNRHDSILPFRIANLAAKCNYAWSKSIGSQT